MRVTQLGWVLAAAMAGVAIGGGFQVKANKVGFIDMQSIYADSKLKEKNDAKLHIAGQNRQAAFDFLRLNPEFTADQLIRYRELSTKETLTPAEAAELTKLKGAAQTATNQFDDLRKKPNPSAEDLKRLNDLAAINDANKVTQADWSRDFSQQLQTMQTDLNMAALDAIKLALAQVAKPQGYTLVFRENVAVYGANNLGTEVKKIVDKNAK